LLFESDPPPQNGRNERNGRKAAVGDYSESAAEILAIDPE
jgi:hypothetical protein